MRVQSKHCFSSLGKLEKHVCHISSCMSVSAMSNSNTNSNKQLSQIPYFPCLQPHCNLDTKGGPRHQYQETSLSCQDPDQNAQGQVTKLKVRK